MPDIEVPKGWRLMVPGEITTTKDMCKYGPIGSKKIDHWQDVSGIRNELVDGNGLAARYICIRLKEKPDPKKKRVPKKEWLNPWD